MRRNRGTVRHLADKVPSLDDSLSKYPSSPGTGATMRHLWASRNGANSGCLDGGELPRSVDDLGVGPVQPDQIVPALHDGQAVGPVVVAASEMDDDGAVWLSCEAVMLFSVLAFRSFGSKYPSAL